MDEDDIGGMMDKMRHMLGGHKHKVVKSIKPTEEEVMEWMALQGYAEAAKKALGTHSSRKDLFWSKIQIRTGEVTRKLHYNADKQIIEVIECETKKEEEFES